MAQGTWTLPATEAFRPVLDRVHGLAAHGGGIVAVFDADPHDSSARAFLEDAFRAARIDEWHEFDADCGKFIDEIAREISSEKFTFAELEEEEQSLDRLRRWFRELRRRDVLELPETLDAAERLRECESRLENFSERVYRHIRIAAD